MSKDDKFEIERKEFITQLFNEKTTINKALRVLQHDKEYADGLKNAINTLQVQNKELKTQNTLELLRVKNELAKYKDFFKEVRKLDEPPKSIMTTTSTTSTVSVPPIKRLMDKSNYSIPIKKRKKYNVCKRCFKTSEEVCQCTYKEYVSGGYCKGKDCKRKLIKTDFKCNLYATQLNIRCVCEGKSYLYKCSACGRWFHEIPFYPGNYVALYCEFKAGKGRFKDVEDIEKIKKKIDELNITYKPLF